MLDINGYKTIFSIAAQLYKQTQEEMSSEECGLSTLQSTIYNLNMAAYLAYGVCDIGEGEKVL